MVFELLWMWELCDVIRPNTQWIYILNEIGNLNNNLIKEIIKLFVRK